MAGPAPSVSRLTATLTFLAQHPNEAFTLTELCRELKQSPATAHAYLNALVDDGFLLREPVGRKYSLGPALIEIGAAAAARQGNVVEFARMELKELAADLGHECVITQVIGQRIMFIAREGPAGPLGTTTQVGERLPLEPPLGTVFIAWSAPEDIEGWLRSVSPGTSKATIQKCVRAVQVVRERGYSVSQQVLPQNSRVGKASLEHLLNSRYFLDRTQANCSYSIGHIGAPVFDATGQVVIALSCAYFGDVITGSQLRRDAAKIVAAADRVTRTIRGTVPGTAR